MAVPQSTAQNSSYIFDLLKTSFILSQTLSFSTNTLTHKHSGLSISCVNIQKISRVAEIQQKQLPHRSLDQFESGRGNNPKIHIFSEVIKTPSYSFNLIIQNQYTAGKVIGLLAGAAEIKKRKEVFLKIFSINLKRFIGRS